MTETTRRLKLRIPSGTSQDSRYNLQRIDDFAGAYNLSDTGDLIIAVRGDLILSPNARSAGGSGSGGVLSFGTSEENVAVTFYTSTLNFEKPLSLKNQLTGETNYLSVQYSSADGDNTNKTLTLDVQSGNRSLTLGGNLSLAGNLITSGSFPVTLTFTAATSVTFPETGVLVTTDATQTLTDKTIVVADNTVTVAAGELNAVLAAIQVDLDSKTDNGGFTSHTGAVGGVHGVTGNVVGTSDAQTLINKTIISPVGLTKSDVGLSNVDNTSDVAKDAATTTLTNKTINGSNNSISNISLASSVVGTLPIANGGTGQTTQNAALNALLPTQTGNINYVLQTDGTDTSWAPAGSGTVTSVDLAVPSEFSVSGNPVTTSGTITISKANQNANLVYAGPGTGAAAAPAFRSLVADDIPSTASFVGKDTDDLAEGTTNKYDQTVALTEGTGIDVTGTYPNFTITNSAPDQTVSLTEGTGIDVTGTYPNFTIANTLPDQTVAFTDGAGINVTGTYPNFTVASTITQYTQEMAQDDIGTILVDSSSIDFTYNDGTPSITAVVLPAGVDHDSLNNFVSNEHIDHSSVSVATSATSGLAGGGDITATRNITVSPTSATAATPAGGDVVLFADVSDSSNLKKATIQELLDLGGGKVTATWIPGDGTSKAITHSLATDDISFNIYDLDTKEEIWVDTAIRTSTSVLTLTSSVAPSGTGWRVVIRK